MIAPATTLKPTRCLAWPCLLIVLLIGLVVISRISSAAVHTPVVPTSPASPVSPVSPVSLVSEDKTTQELRVGVLVFMSPAAAAQEWEPIQQYLRKALTDYQVNFVYLDLDTMTEAAITRSVDFVLTNPGHYVSLEVSAGASRIATLEDVRHSINGLGLGSAVIARAARDDLNTLQDLQGHTLAATTAEGFGGYQTVWRELAALGINPNSDLKALNFVGFPMSRVMDAVVHEHADAGIVRTCVLETLPDWQTHYKVLSPQPDTGFGCAVSTRLYPGWPFATLRHTSGELAREVAIALLQMPATQSGSRFTVPADYQSVHDLFRELHIGPYAYLRDHSIAALAQRHWPILAAFGALLLLWLAYTYRVEKLVHARTRALRETLEERKQIEARMRASQESLDHMSRVSILGELSTTLAHELSQPLAGISNYGRSLLRRLDNGRLDDDTVRLAATEITQQAQHAANVLSRIRAFARKRVSVRQNRHPVQVVTDAVTLFCGMQSEPPQVRINDQLTADVQIRVDSLQIQQVMLNLMKNGMDAMRTVPVDQQCIDIMLSQKENNIIFDVRDYGSGLTTAEQSRLFEPFYTDKTNGLGLGLSICYSIAEAHGGTLSAHPPPQGQGMIFSLSLPIAQHGGNMSGDTL